MTSFGEFAEDLIARILNGAIPPEQSKRILEDIIKNKDKWTFQFPQDGRTINDET
jgi:hypothetical protein